MQPGILRPLVASLALGSALALGACGGGDGVQVLAQRADGEKLSADDRAALDFVRTKLESHWTKGPDGWTTELQQRNLFGQVLEGIPDVHFHQYREFKLSIRPEPVSEAMELNGTDYRAAILFERTPERTFREVDTFEGPRGWSAWSDGSPAFGSLAVERRSGQWLIQDDALFEGLKPESGGIPPGK
jgi:hypothetical protein